MVILAAAGRFAVRFRWAVVAAWVAAAVLATAFLPVAVQRDQRTAAPASRRPAARLRPARLAAPLEAADQTPVPVRGCPLTAGR